MSRTSNRWRGSVQAGHLLRFDLFIFEKGRIRGPLPTQDLLINRTLSNWRSIQLESELLQSSNRISTADFMTVTIYHNPECGTSRNTLALIRNAGIEPQVIEYLRTPPDRETLTALIEAMGMQVHDVIRQKGTPYAELRLDDQKWTEAQLIDFMLQYPILINRPIVVTELGTRLCRPSEVVLDILPAAQQGAFAKEDGELVIDTQGRRIL